MGLNYFNKLSTQRRKKKNSENNKKVKKKKNTQECSDSFRTTAINFFIQDMCNFFSTVALSADPI